MTDIDLKELQKRLKDAGNRGLTRELNKGIRDALNPLKKEFPKSALRRLPRRGGLAKRVAESKISIKKRSGSVTLVMKNQDDYQLVKMDDPGIVRHPVFPRRSRLQRITRTNQGPSRLQEDRKKWAWESQRVRPGWFTVPARAGGDRAKTELENALKRVARQIEG